MSRSLIQLAVDAAYERGFWDAIEAVREDALSTVLMPEDWQEQAQQAANAVYESDRDG